MSQKKLKACLVSVAEVVTQQSKVQRSHAGRGFCKTPNVPQCWSPLNASRLTSQVEQAAVESSKWQPQLSDWEK